MNWLRRIVVLAVFANAGVWFWRAHEPATVRHSLPATEPGVPALILSQEYRKLRQGERRLQGDCWLIGPYPDEAALARAWQSLEYIALDVQKRRINPGGTTRYELVVPASATRKAAELLAESLTVAGIQAPVVRADNTLFLGAYPDLAQAESLQRQAEQLGIEVRLSSHREAPEAQWWLEVMLRNSSGFAQWQAEQTPRMLTVSCGRQMTSGPASGVQ